MKYQIIVSVTKLCFLFFIIIPFNSCGGGEYRLDDHDLKMIRVLADAHVAESAMEAIPDKAVKDSLALVWYGQIFEIHRTNKAEFEKYLREIAENTEHLNSVYTAVTDTLKKRGK